MKNVLVVNPIYQNITPRSIRTVNLLKRLKKFYNVHNLYFELGKNSLEDVGIIHHRIELGNWLNRKRLLSTKISFWIKLAYIIRLKISMIKDPFKFELRTIENKLIELDQNFNYFRIIILISPYSLYSLAKCESLSKKILLDIGDPFYHNSVFNRKISENAKQFEGAALRSVSKIIVTNEATKDLFCKEYDLEANNVFVIPQGYDDRFFKMESKIKNQNQTKISIIYAGRFYSKKRDPIPLLNAIRTWNAGNRIKFTLDLYGNLGMNLNRYIDDYITLHKPICQDELLKKINNADINLFIDNKNSIQTPGKIFELLATRKSILFIMYSKNSITYELVKNCRGVFFSLNHEVEIIQELENIVVNFTKGLSGTICNFDLVKYSWDSLFENYKYFIELN